jgi:hypothetical protein
MFRIAMFVIIGALLGAGLRFPAFARVFCVVLVVYAVFDWERVGLQLIDDLVLAAVALQIGYFVILVAFVLHHRFRRHL